MSCLERKHKKKLLHFHLHEKQREIFKKHIIIVPQKFSILRQTNLTQDKC